MNLPYNIIEKYSLTESHICGVRFSLTKRSLFNNNYNTNRVEFCQGTEETDALLYNKKPSAPYRFGGFVVELTGFEPVISTLPV